MRYCAVAFVVVAIFAFTAIVPAPMLALFDAQTPIDALFWSPATSSIPTIEDAALPQAPAIDQRSPRAPPVA